jgi:hypothetical protein
MSRASVEDILRDIDSPNDEERLALERQIAQRLEADWEREAAVAREEARSRGIDQDAIDRAVGRERYTERRSSWTTGNSLSYFSSRIRSPTSSSSAFCSSASLAAGRTTAPCSFALAKTAALTSNAMK